MGHSPHLRCLRTPGVDQSTVEPSQIAEISVVELPFRISLGRFFRYVVGDSSLFEVCGLNRIDLPREGVQMVSDLPLASDRGLVNTRIAVIETSAATDADATQIRELPPFALTPEIKSDWSNHGDLRCLFLPNYHKHASVIRRFIEAYYTTCPPEFSGHDLRPVLGDDMLRHHVVFVMCLTNPGESLPDKLVRRLLLAENSRLSEPFMAAGFLRDRPLNERRKLRRELRAGESSLSQRMWLWADWFQGTSNQEMAVVTAVAALEAAIAVFARERLESSLGRKDLNNLLRDQGLYTLVPILPKLFFKSKNQPPETTIDGVRAAIEARNAIMHGKLAGDGKPVIDHKGNLGEAIWSCRDLIDRFEAESCRSRGNLSKRTRSRA